MSREMAYSNQAFSLWPSGNAGWPLLDVINRGGCCSCTAEEDQLDLEEVAELIKTLESWVTTAKAARTAYRKSMEIPDE